MKVILISNFLVKKRDENWVIIYILKIKKKNQYGQDFETLKEFKTHLKAD